MIDLKLDIIVLPTYNKYNMAVLDASTYPTDPPVVNTPWLQITVPGFGLSYNGAFTVNAPNVFTSTTFGFTELGEETPLPDGIYLIKYTVNPATEYFVEKSIMRVDRIQEKFDKVFMQLDMMECDNAIKTQSKVELNSIYFMIQGAIAAANDCATIASGKLYDKADSMLDKLLANGCLNNGNNFIINFG